MNLSSNFPSEMLAHFELLMSGLTHLKSTPGNNSYDSSVNSTLIFIIEGEGGLVNEAGEEQPLKAGDFVLVNPNEKHQYRNKGDKPFRMICRGCQCGQNRQAFGPGKEITT